MNSISDEWSERSRTWRCIVSRCLELDLSVSTSGNSTSFISNQVIYISKLQTILIVICSKKTSTYWNEIELTERPRTSLAKSWITFPPLIWKIIQFTFYTIALHWWPLAGNFIQFIHLEFIIANVPWQLKQKVMHLFVILFFIWLELKSKINVFSERKVSRKYWKQGLQGS